MHLRKTVRQPSIPVRIHNPIIYFSIIGGVTLANIKSAKKRILVNRKRAERNKSIRSAVKTSIKGVEAAITAGDKAAAEEALKKSISAIDRACTKGVYHKNNASRKVSRLSKAVNKMA